MLLHGGPVGGLVCGEHPDPSAWVSAGFTVFMPDFRSSGIARKHLMTEAFRRPWLPAADPEAGDVLAGVDMLIANGAEDGHAFSCWATAMAATWPGASLPAITGSRPQRAAMPSPTCGFWIRQAGRCKPPGSAVTLAGHPDGGPLHLPSSTPGTSVRHCC